VQAINDHDEKDQGAPWHRPMRVGQTLFARCVHFRQRSLADLALPMDISHPVAMSKWDDDLPRYWGVGNRPFVRPHAPDRGTELLLISFSGIFLLVTLGMAAYLYISLEMPSAVFLPAPLLIVVAGFAGGAKIAQSKRIRAEREVARYESGVASAADLG
jgi:hypothetical protein